ncbi:prepilin peptidase-dependent protein [Erwinia tasmaniensis]|uniref:prepilin peptidase-dependent protein n=1 Tax=Erwinia tasmaniensis TaxID=338565 RepID=UPI003A4D3F79
MWMRNAGFSLPEMLIALAISSIVMLGATRLLPVLQMNNLRTLKAFQLQEEMQQMMTSLEKAVRRAGYCPGQCQGEGLSIRGASGSCLLIRWDENSNGRWEAAGRDDSDYHGYRLRSGNLEMQRGINDCEGSGWERLNDPAVIAIDKFQVTQRAGQVRLLLAGYALIWPQHPLVIERWVRTVNL